MARDAAYLCAEQKIEEARQSRAKELNLPAMGLTELPESLGQLSQLRSLSLTRNKLTVLPKSLDQLAWLQSLNLSHNILTNLPESLGRLTQLNRLILFNNQLTELPESFDQLTQLRELNLYNNKLKMLPESLGCLACLTKLNLSQNQLTKLPESLGQLAHLRELNLSHNQLTELPETVGQLSHLPELNLSYNQLTELPDSLGQLIQLQKLTLSWNQLTELPDSLGQLMQLQRLELSHNRLTALPVSVGQLKQLGLPCHLSNQICELPTSVTYFDESSKLDLSYNQLTSLPESLGQLTQLQNLNLSNNRLTTLPVSLTCLSQLRMLNLENNPLNPELTAADEEGLKAILQYLRAEAEAGQAVLNEAKLVLIGEGDVGKSCLLAALRGDPWEEGRPTTHGIEIKPVRVTDPATGAEIKLNGWDFGGQRVYRPTHQLFFSAPAVYIVVWKPREGPQQGFVKEWIKLVKHREPDAKILVVATHGGPKERQPDIDRQEIWDLFGPKTVIRFFSVESRPDPKTGERLGIAELRDSIARVAAGLPEMGRSFPKRWQEAREKLCRSEEAYLPLDRVLVLCGECGLAEEDSRLLLRICRRVGDLIHYEHDPALCDIVVLKPDWLATAISYVLDDEHTRNAHGLVGFARLSEVWNDPARSIGSRYDPNLHPLFLRLMERFDLSYKVAVPAEPEDALGFWQRVGKTLGLAKRPPADLRYTSLIAQLVPDVRPEAELAREWPVYTHDGDCERVQICRIVETKNGQSATAEGLFFQMIVRLHKYSLGRMDYRQSVHWQRGLVLDDGYNGRALLEHVGNDVRITVRAPYPQGLLAVLTHEVKWLVESFWRGLRCDVMVPCVKPCGKNLPGTGLFEVQKLIAFKKQGMKLFPCPVSGCDQAQNIDCLLQNAPAARVPSIESLVTEGFGEMRLRLEELRRQNVMLDQNLCRIMSQVDDAFRSLMQTMTDEGKEGPRLFSLEPVDRSPFNPNDWVKKKFRITLWCEHSRLPLPLLNGHDRKGVYVLDVTREWFAKAAPFLKTLSGTLSLVLPVAASAAKLALDEAIYRRLENQLDFGKSCAEAMLDATGKISEWLTETDELEAAELVGVVCAQGGALREFQTWLKKQDPSFGDLRRVLNKQNEFLWVHRDFNKEY